MPQGSSAVRPTNGLYIFYIHTSLPVSLAFKVWISLRGSFEVCVFAIRVNLQLGGIWQALH